MTWRSTACLAKFLGKRMQSFHKMCSLEHLGWKYASHWASKKEILKNPVFPVFLWAKLPPVISSFVKPKSETLTSLCRSSSMFSHFKSLQSKNFSFPPVPTSYFWQHAPNHYLWTTFLAWRYSIADTIWDVNRRDRRSSKAPRNFMYSRRSPWPANSRTITILSPKTIIWTRRIGRCRNLPSLLSRALGLCDLCAHPRSYRQKQTHVLSYTFCPRRNTFRRGL